MKKIVKQYLETALWSSNDEKGIPFDRNYTLDDCAESLIERAIKDCDDLIKQSGYFLEGLDEEDLGHDFWLTRNRHGAGFWDGDYEEEVGKKLTNISHKFGEINLYLGDDGKIYSE